MALERPLYVLEGNEPVRRRYLLSRLQEQAGSLERLSAASCQPEEVLAGSLLLDPEAPLIRILEDYSKWSATQRKRFVSGVAELESGQGLCVVLVLDRLGAKDVLHQALAKDALIQIEQPRRGSYPQWVVRQARLLGLELPPGWPERLVQMIGEDTEALNGEMQKVALLAVDGKVEPEDLAALVVARDQSQVWIWADAMISGDQTGALSSLAACEAADDAPLALLGALWSKILSIAWASSLDQASSGLKDYGWQKAHAAIAGGWDRPRVKKAILALAQTEAGLKGASGLDGYSQLARLTARGF